jgi:hypothetical protein
MSNRSQRFGDLTLDNKPLPACYGYLSSKLVSLEEAIQPLQNHLEKIEQFAKLSKKHCKFPNENDLSKEESAALYLYTMEMGDNKNVYASLNRILRDENRNKIKPYFSYLKLLHAGVSKLQSVKERVWRAVKENVSDKFKKGATFTWWTVTSCSKELGTTESFLGKDGGTVFSIDCINGKLIQDYSANPSEEEIILMPGTKLKVVSNPINRGGLAIIQLKEVEDEENSPSQSLQDVSDDDQYEVLRKNEDDSEGEDPRDDEYNSGNEDQSDNED